MIQSWENLVKDGRTDEQTDESDFIGRCPSNVERPIIKNYSIIERLQDVKKGGKKTGIPSKAGTFLSLDH